MSVLNVEVPGGALCATGDAAVGLQKAEFSILTRFVIYPAIGQNILEHVLCGLQFIRC